MKEKMIKFIKRYRIFILLLIINTAVLVIFPNLGKKAFQLTASNLLEMLSVLPPIFILLGLLDVEVYPKYWTTLDFLKSIVQNCDIIVLLY